MRLARGGPSEEKHNLLWQVEHLKILHVLDVLQSMSSVLLGLMFRRNENTPGVRRQHQVHHIKVLFSPPLRLTWYKLCEQLVVAVDDVDRHVPGRLQEQRAALPRHGQHFLICSLCIVYLVADCNSSLLTTLHCLRLTILTPIVKISAPRRSSLPVDPSLVVTSDQKNNVGKISCWLKCMWDVPAAAPWRTWAVIAAVNTIRTFNFIQTCAWTGDGITWLDPTWALIGPDLSQVGTSSDS